MKKIAACLALAGIAFAPQASSAEVQRPPQFVAIAFDNCTELERWQEWSDFAAAMQAEGRPLHFTFFVSGVNFLADADRRLYRAPHQAAGAARINFGGSVQDVRRRMAFIRALHRDGHEIASHAVGHFDGRRWSAADWDTEFRSFDRLLHDAVAASGPAAADESPPAPDNIVGFRAPYLAHGPGLYAVLAARGFRYDTSGTAAAQAWPEKRDRIWRFNLAGIRLAGARRTTLSMDYNFLVAQSGAAPIAARREEFRRQMLESYLAYFRANYAGNRAPLHIGHHFTDYQNGAYREALKSFARAVCGLPEVRCVSYRTLADFMDKLSPETLAAYRSGDFPRAEEPAFDVAAARAEAAR